MKNKTLAIQGGAGIAVLALLGTLAQADSLTYSDLSDIELDVEKAAVAANGTSTGQIMEIELEMDDGSTIWEVDLVNNDNQMVTLEIDAQSGEILSTKIKDDIDEPLISALQVEQAIEIVKAVENGIIVEAELEKEDGTLVWEVESIGADNQEKKFRVDAETGQLLS